LREAKVKSLEKEETMGIKKILLLITLLVLVSCGTIFAAWQNVAPGIDYQEFNLSDPNNVYVTRMDRATTSVIIDSGIGSGILASGRETVSAIAARYDDSFGYWGEQWGKYRYDVVAAINGSGFDSGTGSPSGGQIISGWYAKRWDEFDYTGPVWKLDRDMWLGACPRHRPEKNFITCMPSGTTQAITGINRARTNNDDLIIYTCHYDRQTPPESDGVEVLLEMQCPAMILPPPSYAKGYVKQIRVNVGSTPIPFDHVVLSAKGPSADLTLLDNVSIGSEVRISQEITHYEDDCNTPYHLDFTKTYASVRYMTFRFLEGGAPHDLGKSGAYNREPRTAVAYNDNYIYFIVVDGRSSISIGMTMEELGNFCLNYLGATDGMNMDGGGSSTMWVNGLVKNSPSDGAERAVANGLMMIQLLPKQTSCALAVGNQVQTNGSTYMRLGPGSNFESLTTISGGLTATIIDHALNGISAKGKYWWKCNYAGNEGWLSEDMLQIVTTPTPPGYAESLRWELYH
jgi:hypothetical protein